MGQTNSDIVEPEENFSDENGKWHLGNISYV